MEAQSAQGTERWIDLFNADVTTVLKSTDTGDTYLNQLVPIPHLASL